MDRNYKTILDKYEEELLWPTFGEEHKPLQEENNNEDLTYDDYYGSENDLYGI